MKNSILVISFLSIGVVVASCSVSPSDSDGSGGTTALGGSNASGGVTSSGGQPGTGGRTDSGGQVGSGGTTTSGGRSGSGGDSIAGAGQTGTGGTIGSGGAVAGRTGTGGRLGSGGATASGGESDNGTGGRSGQDAAAGTPRGTGGIGTGGVSATGGGTAAGTGGTAGSSGTGAGTPSAGCGKTPTLTSGSRTIQSGGSRSYILRIPSNYDNTHPYRLVFAFHWNGGTMNDIDGGGSSGAVWSYYGLQAQANNSTIFVAPQGNGNGWANSGGADLAFVDAMVKLIEDDLCVDTTRIFALGFSYGGGMSYAIACARAKVFRAVAVYSGAQLSGCDGGKDPIAYLGIHGISDGTCNISGGRSLRDKFVANNGCTAQSPPEPSGGSLTHKCTTYTGCKTGYPVEWCAFDGGHTPGMVDGGGDDGAKTWTKAETWKFFTQF
jgi:poly(3-hydroxybutyrate) depolymerase